MFKTSVILGLVLLFVGATLLGWVALQQDKQKQLEQAHDNKLKAELEKLDNVAGDRIDTHQFNGLEYEPANNHKEEVRNLEEKKGLFLTIGGVLALTGGGLVFSCLLLVVARLLIKASRLLSGLRRTTPQQKNEQVIDSDTEELQQQPKPKQREKPVGIFANFAANQRPDTQIGRKTHKQNEKIRIPVRHHQHKSRELPEPVTVSSESTQSDETVMNSDGYQTVKNGSFNECTKDWTDKSGQSAQTAVLQVEAPSQQHRPWVESMSELAEQVSAIREYAAHQQERVNKLQDGYDWGIIKNFCLRIIRCIDHLESRINALADSNGDAAHLQEVKDELIFALESTGVEQYEPEINSDYRGQEKRAEAIKEKQSCSDTKLTGKIARVIRPGYQYFIDDDNFKVVRTAQVKLFA